MLRYRFIYRCQACGLDHTEVGQLKDGDDPPLLNNSVRPLHCEVDPNERRCMGLVRYVRTEYVHSTDAVILAKAVSYLLRQNVPKTSVNLATLAPHIAAFWTGITNVDVAPGSNPPEGFYDDLRKAYLAKLDELERSQPHTCREWLDQFISSGNLQPGRTLCVAYYRSKNKAYVGYSGGQYTTMWQRIDADTVQATQNQSRLADLERALSATEKKSALGREVWVCGEVDSAVKALLDDPSITLDALEFMAAEAPAGQVRIIRECSPCLQWAYT